MSSDNGNQQSSIDGSSNGTTQNGNGTSNNGDCHDNEQENGCDTSMKKEYKVNSNNKVSVVSLIITLTNVSHFVYRSYNLLNSVLYVNNTWRMITLKCLLVTPQMR